MEKKKLHPLSLLFVLNSLRLRLQSTLPKSRSIHSQTVKDFSIFTKVINNNSSNYLCYIHSPNGALTLLHRNGVKYRHTKAHSPLASWYCPSFRHPPGCSRWWISVLQLCDFTKSIVSDRQRSSKRALIY